MHVHHCIHGNRRKAADKYGLTVHLCPGCHQALHDKGDYDMELKWIAQDAFEAIYSHEEYMEIFGRNYRKG